MKHDASNWRRYGIGSHRRSVTALTSACLLLTLIGCATEPEIVTRTEYVEKRVVERVRVPEGLLAPCRITPLPARGASWHEIWVIMEEKHFQQRSCNERFSRIRDWQSEDDDG